MNRVLHKYVRYAEVLVVVVLLIFAVVTYQELAALRKAPVILPSYLFEISSEGESGSLVQTRGTWVAESGPREPLQTTTIECRKSRMECVESVAAIVFVSGKGILESTQTVFAVAHWNDAEIATRPVSGPCSNRALMLDLVNKRARSRVSASEEKGRCKELPERTLELVAGFSARENSGKSPP